MLYPFSISWTDPADGLQFALLAAQSAAERATWLYSMKQSAGGHMGEGTEDRSRDLADTLIGRSMDGESIDRSTRALYENMINSKLFG